MADTTNLDKLLYYISPQRVIDEFRNTVYSDEERAELRAKEQERRLNQKRRCGKCNAVFKHRDMQWLNIPGHSKLYCVDRFPKVEQRYTFTCHKCEVNFLSRQQRTLCDQCRIYDRKALSDLIQRHKRKSKQKGLPAYLDLYDWLDTIKHFDGKCAYCQKQPFQELDHFNPHGGTMQKNCIPACYVCNHDKSNFDPSKPRLHRGTNYINLSRSPKYMNRELFIGIKRVAAYLNCTFPFEYPEPG